MLQLDTTTHERLPTILDETADQLLQSARWTGRPVDAIDLAKRLGMTIARDRKLNGRARYVRLSTGGGRARGAIFVGEADRPERLQWAVAHELGEFAVHRVFERVQLAPDAEEPALREQLANELARRILLPPRSFEIAGAACNWDLAELKQSFPAASHELIARRMLDFPPPVVVTVCDHGRVHWRRSNQAATRTAMDQREQELMQLAHESECYHEQKADDLYIRVWPVHEPGWKREILRAEPRWYDE